MRQRHTSRSINLLLLSIASLTVSALGADPGKIPITIASSEGRDAFLKGRDITERLKVQEAIQFFEKAVTLDPGSAIAELNLALVQPTAKGFFEHLAKAVALAPMASEGERLQILGVDAGAKGEPQKQKEYLTELVAKYPEDERAHTALGNFLFGQQEYQKAIDAYNRAIGINPQFSAPYNQLGYAYRFQEKYKEAEEVFKKYTELIPDDPNPYDSYAELLMKTGKFDASIASYRKALAVDSMFASAMRGIAWDLMFEGKHGQARLEVQASLKKARNDGERRIALFSLVLLSTDEGKTDRALTLMQEEYEVARAAKDPASMAADLATMGTILCEAGRQDEALGKFKESLGTIERSDLSKEVKDLARLGHHYNVATVCLGKKDVSEAKSESAVFRAGAEARKNAFQTRRAHELLGMIAVQEHAWRDAVDELQQANQQDPYNIFRMALAYRGMGQAARAREYFLKAAHHNSLPILSYTFIRQRAAMMAATL